MVLNTQGLRYISTSDEKVLPTVPVRQGTGGVIYPYPTMVGRVAVVQSDLQRRDLRLIVAAVEGCAERVFSSDGGVAALPGAIGQGGLGSHGRVSKEVASKAALFASTLQEFLSRQLSPGGWIVIMGGRIGFAFRSKQRSSAVLRAVGGDKEAPVSIRKSCVIVIYRAPTVVEVPPWLLQAKEAKLVVPPPFELSPASASLAEASDESLQTEKADADNDINEAPESPSLGPTGIYPEVPTKLENTPSVNIKIRTVTVISPPTPSSSSSVNCPPVIAQWGFLQLSKETQTRKLLETLESAAKMYQVNRSGNIQQLAQLLRDHLMAMSGPLWHVCVGREDVQVKTGQIFCQTHLPNIHQLLTCIHSIIM